MDLLNGYASKASDAAQLNPAPGAAAPDAVEDHPPPVHGAAAPEDASKVWSGAELAKASDIRLELEVENIKVL